MRKLSTTMPWTLQDHIPDVTIVKIHFSDDPQIQVHQSRVQPCPSSFPRGFYWYGGKRSRPGRPPRWIEKRIEQIGTILKEPSLSTTRDSLLLEGGKSSIDQEVVQQSKEMSTTIPTTTETAMIADVEESLGQSIEGQKKNRKIKRIAGNIQDTI